MIIKTLLITQMLLDIVFASSCNFANSNYIPLSITFSIFLAIHSKSVKKEILVALISHAAQAIEVYLCKNRPVLKLCMGKKIVFLNREILLQIAAITYRSCVFVVCCQRISSHLDTKTKIFQSEFVPV